MADELFTGGQKMESITVEEKAAPATVSMPLTVPAWRSQAPNGIDINRSGVNELCMLNGVGAHLAQTIIDYRKEHGAFNRLQDLLEVPGLGSHTYRKMTKLAPATDVRDAELQINTILGIDSESVSLNKTVGIVLERLHLNAVFISSVDGLILAKKAKDNRYLKLADSLAAVAPQLYKRGLKALKQGQLPSADMFTFYVGINAVTFAGSDQLFLIYVHDQNYPQADHVATCREVATELVWYCSCRAVIS